MKKSEKIKELLIQYGFEIAQVIESRNDYGGYVLNEVSISFLGSEMDLIKAYEICENYGLDPITGKRLYSKNDLFNPDQLSVVEGSNPVWVEPINELIFTF